MKGRNNRRNIKHYRRKRSWIAWAVPVIFLCIMLFLIAAWTGIFTKKAKITIAAVDVEILQGEELPELKAEVTSEDSEKVMLDKKEKYSADDLIKELKDGTGYTLESKADAATEGVYNVSIKLDQKLQDKISDKWKKRVELTVKNGKVTVKNPVGTWEGNKFKKYDGTYVTSDFVVSKGKTYYFGEDGNKVTDWQTLAQGTYYFNDKGVMETGWHEKEDKRYYMGGNGAAVVGWQELEGKTYYFDEEGKMAVGEVKVGLTKCVFDEDGSLISKEESSIDPSKPMVALTFDDGPGKRTGELLDQLEKYNAHATFFMLGQKVASNAEVVKRMAGLGCELGNHSYSHKDLAKQSASVVQKEMNDTNSKITAAAGQSATVMRPPYGSIGGSMRENVGLPMILWNIDTLDWKTRNAQTTIDTVMNNVKDGDIILMHDIHSESVDAGLQLIPKLEEAGFQLVTVSEMAAAKGITLTNGEKYTDF